MPGTGSQRSSEDCEVELAQQTGSAHGHAWVWVMALHCLLCDFGFVTHPLWHSHVPDGFNTISLKGQEENTGLRAKNGRLPSQCAPRA